MRAVNLSLVTLVVLAITSCIPSIHPIYDADTQVYDPALLGTWTSEGDGQTWVFSAGLWQKNTYLLEHIDDDGISGKFTVNMAQIGGERFINLFPEEWEFSGNDFYDNHHFRAHTFMRVELLENDLRLYVMDFNWLDEYLKSDPNAIAHTYANLFPKTESENQFPILTAGTAQLQAFLESIATTSEAWIDPIELKREIAVARDDWDVRIEGDKLYLDEESWLAKRYIELGKPPPVFHRFDGDYPPEWNQNFKLPDGFFLGQENLELAEVSVETMKGPAYIAGARSIRFRGLSPLSIEETISWFRDQGISAGLDITTDELQSTIGGLAWEIKDNGPGLHSLCFHDEQGNFFRVYLSIWLHQDLGDFTYVTCSITVDINK